MTFAVELLDEVGAGFKGTSLDQKTATRLCRMTFSELGYVPDELGEVSVVLVGVEDIHCLNRDFRGKDSPTDVLSFTMDGPGGEMVGEIVICPEKAVMGLDELVVHGTLHLSGMDHGDDFEASEMHDIQQRIMDEYDRNQAV